jgi:hypothetical protein
MNPNYWSDVLTIELPVLLIASVTPMAFLITYIWDRWQEWDDAEA